MYLLASRKRLHEHPEMTKMTRLAESFNLPIEEKECISRIYRAFRNFVEKDMREFIQEKPQMHSFDIIGRILVNSTSKFAIVINGIPGTGKTTILRSLQVVINELELADPLYNTETSFVQAGLSIIDATELCQIFQKSATTYDRYKNQSLLAIDDLGAEPQSIVSYGNLYTPIADLIAYRYQRRMFTILTTNTPTADIRPRYGDRIADRLNEMAYVVTMPSINFRML